MRGATGVMSVRGEPSEKGAQGEQSAQGGTGFGSRAAWVAEPGAAGEAGRCR